MNQRKLYKAWRYYSSVTGLLSIAVLMTYSTVSILSSSGGPVVITRDVVLHTPRVPVGGNFTFSLWRESRESCPGTIVVSYFDSAPDSASVVSSRFPLATPGYQSPPRLTITRPIPRQIGPGLWNVVVGVKSECPTRRRFDKTAEFTIEVYSDDQDPN